MYTDMYMSKCWYIMTSEKHPNQMFVGAMGLWGYRAIGLWGNRVIGLAGYRAIGLLGYWAIGL